MELVIGDAPFVEKPPKQHKLLKGTLKLIWKGSLILATSVEKLAGPVMHLTPTSVHTTKIISPCFQDRKRSPCACFQISR